MSSDSSGAGKPARSIDGIVAHSSRTEPPAPTRKKLTFKLKLPLKLSKKVAYGCVGLVLLAGIATGVVLLTRNSNTLPTSIVRQASFPLYYPSPMTGGYTYKQGSARFENGVVFYTLRSGSDGIVVSEQPAPASLPDLTHLLGFTSLKTIAGNAVVGSSNAKQPIVVIDSNTTLITMTGSKGMPSDVVSALAQNMRSLPQQ